MARALMDEDDSGVSDVEIIKAISLTGRGQVGGDSGRYSGGGGGYGERGGGARRGHGDGPVRLQTKVITSVRRGGEGWCFHGQGRTGH